MKKENKDSLIAFLLCCAFVELILLGFMFLITLETGDASQWVMFAWFQFVVPFAALFPWLIVEGMMYADKERQAQEEWNKRVEKVVKYIEEQKNNEKED